MESSKTLADVRIPPQNLEAEEAVVGAVLQSNDALEAVMRIIDIDDFYREAHRKIYQAVLDLSDRREPVDTVTVSNELKNKGHLEIVGGVSRITELIMNVPAPGHAEGYANIIKAKATARKIISATSQIMGNAYSERMSTEELLDSAEKVIFQATERQYKTDFRPASQIAGETFDYLSKLTQDGRHITGIPTGIQELDLMTTGFQDSELIVIGARPSVGKTSLAMNIAQYNSIQRDVDHSPIPCGVFSLEMTAQALVIRLMCSISGVSMQKARAGNLSKGDISLMVESAGKVHGSKIFIDETVDLSITELKMKARRLHKEHGVRMIMVDYLQLIHSKGNHERREQEIAYISRQMKGLAKELKIPVIVLSQLSRPPKGSESRRPVLSDLRESGAIEQDADTVILIHREDAKSEGEKPRYELIVAKQRNGPIGIIPVIFQGDTLTFEGFRSRVTAGEDTRDRELKRYSGDEPYRPREKGVDW